MTSNYDPKPGRWMLPLVVLAMVAFTYVFVRELPTTGATTTTVTTDNGATTTTTDGSTDPTDPTTSTTIAPEAQAYVDALSGFEVRLTDLRAQLGAANTGFDADPRTVSYNEAQDAFEAVLAATTAVADEGAALVPPTGYEDAHATVLAAAQQAVTASSSALDGLNAPAPDTGDARRAGVAAFDDAVEAFGIAVEGVRALASQA